MVVSFYPTGYLVADFSSGGVEFYGLALLCDNSRQANHSTVKILKFGTPQTIAIIVLKIEKSDVTLHKCIQKTLIEWQTA